MNRSRLFFFSLFAFALSASVVWLGCNRGGQKQYSSYSPELSDSGIARVLRSSPAGPMGMAMIVPIGTPIPPTDPIGPGRFNPDFNTESYDKVEDNPFLAVQNNPLSTFSIDVDTASYSNVRRFLNDGMLPPKGAVRIEELVNYFDYDYKPPTGDAPFSTDVALAECPWNGEHWLARIALKGKVFAEKERPACNLVFLLDVSGSMDQPNKLPLLKRSMKLMVDGLDARDRVALAVYAGASGLALDSTPCSDKKKIHKAIDKLNAGGSTNAGEGIELAYKIAEKNMLPKGVNRVILATDGDFNVGVTNQSDLVEMIEAKAKSGVFLTVLGFGMGNYKDSMLEKLADKGNGNYAYIDTFNEARKALGEQLTGTLVTIAKDVKIQVEFNPAEVQAYRLIGYENRMLRAEDFNDDATDAGEIGAGHAVTALYELVPEGARFEGASVDPLKYQTQSNPARKSASGEAMTVKLRYKPPKSDESKLLEFAVPAKAMALEATSGDFRFASAVAAFGMLLRDSPYKGEADMALALKLAQQGKGADELGLRSEFIQLARTAGDLLKNK